MNTQNRKKEIEEFWLRTKVHLKESYTKLSIFDECINANIGQYSFQEYIMKSSLSTLSTTSLSRNIYLLQPL